MTRTLALVLALAACDDPARRPVIDAAIADDYYDPDAPPPPFDAAPLPFTKCAEGPTPCELPPSQCLGEHWLIYYTDASCKDESCAYQSEWLYCYLGCLPDTPGASCNPGFT